MKTTRLLAAFMTHNNSKGLLPSHASLYMALLFSWEQNHFLNPVSIAPGNLMEWSKINSRVTYYKCLRALEKKGYIRYRPSYHPYKESEIWIENIACVEKKTRP